MPFFNHLSSHSGNPGGPHGGVISHALPCSWSQSSYHPLISICNDRLHEYFVVIFLPCVRDETTVAVEDGMRERNETTIVVGDGMRETRMIGCGRRESEEAR